MAMATRRSGVWPVVPLVRKTMSLNATQAVDHDARSTPKIPQWIRDFTLEGYRNIYELLPHEPNLYGSEDLYGDWLGDTLVLGRVHGTVATVTQHIENRKRPAFCHARGEKKTELLKQRVLAGGLNQAIWARECGLLYGDATAGLCRKGVRVTGALPKKEETLTYGAQVLSGFVLQHMPNLQQVVCLGAEAWHVATQAFGVEEQSKKAMPSLKPVDAAPPHGAAVRATSVRLMPLHALGAVSSKVDVQRRWDDVYERVATVRADCGATKLRRAA